MGTRILGVGYPEELRRTQFFGDELGVGKVF